MTKREGRLVTLLRSAQIDRTLVAAFSARLWPLFSGPITIALIVTYFSPEMQGVYYGFSAVLALQAFFELGTSSLIISLAGQEANDLNDQNQETAHLARRRLAAILHGMIKWYVATASLFSIVAFSVGWWTFSDTNTSVSWQLPWLIAVPIVGISLCLTPYCAVLEGIGAREAIYRYRFYQVITGSLAVWLAIIAGLGVWAVVFAAMLQLAWGVYLVFGKYGDLWQGFRQASEPLPSMPWRDQIIPTQWRIALQSAAHYLATQMLTLLAINAEDLEYGGRFGMTMTVMVAIQAISLSWIQTKFSTYSQLVGAMRWEEMSVAWRRSLVVSLAVLGSASLAFSLAVGFFEWRLPNLANRFLDWQQILIIAFALIANHIIASQAYFVLACNRRPLFVPIVLGMGVTVLLIGVGFLSGGGKGVIIGYAVGMVFVALPLHSIAFYYLRMKLSGELADRSERDQAESALSKCDATQRRAQEPKSST